MQSRRRRKKADDGRCGIKIEATRFVAGLRSDQTNRGRPWGRLEDSQRKPRSAITIEGHFTRLAPNGYSGSTIEAPNLIVAVMTCSTSPSLATMEGATPSVLRANDRHVRRGHKMVHSYPSGDPTPSRADITMTQQIVEIVEPLGILVHDHIIVGKKGHASFKGLKLI